MSSYPPDDPARRAPAPGDSPTPPYGYPPPGAQPPYGGAQGGQPPYAAPPAGQQPSYPTPPPPPGSSRAPAQQRRGCRGCFLTCLTVLLACGLLAVIVMAATVYMMRQAFPNATTTQGLLTCAGLRVLVNNEDLVIERGNATAAQKADIRRGFQELRARYERDCAPSR